MDFEDAQVLFHWLTIYLRPRLLRRSATQQSSDNSVSDPAFERRLSRLASQQQQQQSSNTGAPRDDEPLDVLAMEPQIGRPKQQNPQQQQQQKQEASGASDGDGDGGFLTSGVGKVRMVADSLHTWQLLMCFAAG